MVRVAILGSTGSIGTSTLDVILAMPDGFEVVSLSAGSRVAELCEQAKTFRAKRVCVGKGLTDEAKSLLDGSRIEVLEGNGGLVQLAADPDVDMVINGLVAGVGIRPTVAALEAGKDVITANKETLVVAGEVVTAIASEKGVKLIPLDSELTPLWETLQELSPEDVRRIVLPASGGPFFDASLEEMEKVTRDEALNHPTWKMGPKITIDSATLMNKGFEVIESHWFFGLPLSKIDVIIHRQSVVHCMIEYVDGGLLAHLSTTDMRLPIQQALTYPDKLPSRIPTLDLVKVGTLSFFDPDLERFPCLQLCYAAIAAGGTAPAVLNASNEIAVEAFLKEKIGFMDIPRVVQAALDSHSIGTGNLDEIYEADRWAREKAGQIVVKIK
ncbi:MAG: 1-deoxy-D-xylulose-5-phosphate reductoisomerase [Candidatus Latescibacterota bacterium]|nr:1-deoxy-D-xylulose-5-phosphate reductoisomerase [Candidatus Latescibacterota bacterium]